MPKSPRRPILSLFPLLALTLTASALAIQPQRWVHSTESDFEPGATDGTVVTNFGDIRLADKTDLLATLDDPTTVVYDAQNLGGTLYVAVGPEAVLMRRAEDGEGLKKILSLEGEQVFTLDVYQGKLLVGISSGDDDSRLAVLEGEKLRTLAKLPGVRYVWDMLPRDGDILVATGTEGKILRVQPDGESENDQTREAPPAPEMSDADEDAEPSASDTANTTEPPEAPGAQSGDIPEAMGNTPARDADNTTEMPTDAPDQATASDAETADKMADDTEATDDAGADSDTDENAESSETNAETDDAGDTADADDAQDADQPDDSGNAPAARIQTVYQAKQTNVLCLAAGPDGTVYAGTDTEGLVYRLTPGEDGKLDPFVLYDAGEPEIAALLVTDDGTVYAGTADAEQARPGRIAKSQNEEVGRTSAPAANPDIDQVPPPEELDIQGGDGADAAEPTPDQAAPTAPDEVQPKPDQDDQPEPDADDQAPSEAGGEADAGTNQAAPADADAETGQTEAPDESEEPQEPTQDQRDRLREMIRQRLAAARQSGTLSAEGDAEAPGSGPSSAASRARPAAASTGPAKGNAVYRIDPQGFAREVFRESVMVLDLAMDHGKLLIATGNEGQVFAVSPATGETSVLADLDAEQVLRLIPQPGDDSHILLGTANPATLRALAPGSTPRGTYTGPILDATQTSLWGVFSVYAEVPDGANITLETRSGNVKDPEDAPWSPWTKARDLPHDADANALTPRQVKIDAPPARFVQYRLTLTGDGEQTPVISRVELAYVVPNLQPKIASLTASYPEAQRNDEKPPATEMAVKWEASDPNQDRLLYTLEYRPADSKRWLEIKKDITETTYQWETRRVPDGRYLLRVRANDGLDNPVDMAMDTTRRSDMVMVDNTAPVFKSLAADEREVTGKVTDGLSPIRDIAYTLNGEDESHPILPEDLIADSTDEAFTATLPDSAKPGDVVTLRVSDTRGNTSYQHLVLGQ